jgi:hypothetical protein
MAWREHVPTSPDFKAGYDAASKASRLIMNAQEAEIATLREYADAYFEETIILGKECKKLRAALETCQHCWSCGPIARNALAR